jgi:hypothetical protein
MRFLRFLIVAAALFTSAQAGEQTTLKASAQQEASKFAADANTLVGKNKSDVVELIGFPDNKVSEGAYENWKYLRHFGTYRRSKALFGHLTMTIEVNAEILIKNDVVISAKVSNAREVRKPRDR